MYTFYGVTMIICVIAMIVGLFFYCVFQIFFWEDKNLYKLFCGLGLYIWFGFCFGSWLGLGCPRNWYALVSVIAVLMLFAQFFCFKKRWQAFYALDRPLKKLKKAHMFAITALTLCFCGIYGYCNSQRNGYRQKHAEVYTVIGFNFVDSGYGFVPKMDTDEHVFVRLASSVDCSQLVIMSEHYHLGDTVRIFHNKVI